jgi:hypothetical protein
MDKLRSKLVRLSEPGEVADNKKSTSLLQYAFNYDSKDFYGTGPITLHDDIHAVNTLTYHIGCVIYCRKVFITLSTGQLCKDFTSVIYL